MPRRTFRTPTRLAIVVAVLSLVAVLGVGTVVWQYRAAAAADRSGVVATAWGPLRPADRDLLVKVALTCLWEVSTGQQAQQQASGPQVKEVARKIVADHDGFDRKIGEVADRLGVPLPIRPDAQQVAWTEEIAAATGLDYDRVVVQRLREADGYVLPVAQRVRVGTGNELVRDVARDSLYKAIDHVGYLEGTGLVDYSALPEPPSSSPLSWSENWRLLVVSGLVLLACLLVAVRLGMTLGRRKESNRPDRASAASLLAPLLADGDRSPNAPPEAEAPSRRTPAGHRLASRSATAVAASDQAGGDVFGGDEGAGIEPQTGAQKRKSTTGRRRVRGRQNRR